MKYFGSPKGVRVNPFPGEQGDELVEGESLDGDFTLTRNARYVLLTLSGLILIFCIFALFISIFGGSKFVSSSGWSISIPDLEGFEVSIILPAVLLSTIFLTLPWERESLRISKIGPVALEQKIQGQDRQRVIELADIRSQIEELQKNIQEEQRSVVGPEKQTSEVRAEDSVGDTEKISPKARVESSTTDFDKPAPITRSDNSAADAADLAELLVRFLSTYDRWAFSPSRIKEWGGRQAGFEELSEHEVSEIRSKLGQLVAKRILVTRVSKKGNTLYRVPV